MSYDRCKHCNLSVPRGWWHSCGPTPSMAGLLPSEDDDGSAAEIATLRSEVAQLRADLAAETEHRNTAVRGMALHMQEKEEARRERDAIRHELKAAHLSWQADVARLQREVEALQGDRCEVCDEHGLIYVTAWDHANGCESEEAAMCPACGGTRSGYASEVTRGRDDVRTSLAAARAALDDAATLLASEGYEEQANALRAQGGVHVIGAAGPSPLAAALAERDAAREAMQEWAVSRQAAHEMRERAVAERDALAVRVGELLGQFNLQRDNYMALVRVIYGGRMPDFEFDPLADAAKHRAAYRAGTPAAAPRTEPTPPALTPPLTASEREALVEIRAKLEPGRCLCMCHVDKSRAIATIDRLLLSGAEAATDDTLVNYEAATVEAIAQWVERGSEGPSQRAWFGRALAQDIRTGKWRAASTEPGGPPVKEG